MKQENNFLKYTVQLKSHLYVNTSAPFKNPNRSSRITKYCFLKQDSKFTDAYAENKASDTVYFSSDMMSRSLPDIN